MVGSWCEFSSSADGIESNGDCTSETPVVLLDDFGCGNVDDRVGIGEPNGAFSNEALLGNEDFKELPVLVLCRNICCCSCCVDGGWSTICDVAA